MFDPIVHRGDLRQTLLQQGYRPLPGHGKRILLKGWSRLEVTAEWLSNFDRSARFINTGLRCDDLAVFDIDIDSTDWANDCADLIEQRCGISPLCRYSTGGRLLLVYRRGEGDLATRRTGKYEGDLGHYQVEFLTGPGRQFMAYGEHPKGGQYDWDSTAPHEIALTDLPAVDDVTAQQVMAELDQLLAGGGFNLSRGPTELRREQADTLYDLRDDTPVLIDGAALTWSDLKNGLDERGLFGNLMREDGLFGDSDGVHFYRTQGTNELAAYDFPRDVLHYEAIEPVVLPEREDDGQFEREDSAIDYFLREYVLLGDRTVRRLRAPEHVYELGGFVALHSQHTITVEDKPIPVAKIWVKHPEALRAERVAFAPDRDALFVDGAGDRVLNLYRPPVHPEQGGSIETVLEFIKHLVPDARQRDLFLDWHALKVAKPWLRMHGLMMVTQSFGTGRGTWAQIVERLLGASTVANVEFDDLFGTGSQSQYNHYLAESLVLNISEALEFGTDFGERWKTRTRGYERLKLICDQNNSRTLIKRKYGRSSVESVYCSILVATNHANAIAIPAEDRRLMVLSNTEVPLAKAGDLSERIHAWMRDQANVGAFHRWLQERADHADYDPFGPAPMTDAKREMIEGGVSDMDSLFSLYTREAKGDICIAKHFRDFVMKHKLSGEFTVPSGDKLDSAIASVLRTNAKRPRLNGGVIKVGGVTARPWVIRNFDIWCAGGDLDADGRAVMRDELVKNGGVGGQVQPIK